MPSKSKKQQRLMGWVYACKTGKTKHCPKRIKKVAKSISKKAAHDFAKKRVKESVDEALLLDETPLTFKRFLELCY